MKRIPFDFSSLSQERRAADLKPDARELEHPEPAAFGRIDGMRDLWHGSRLPRLLGLFGGAVLAADLATAHSYSDCRYYQLPAPPRLFQ